MTIQEFAAKFGCTLKDARDFLEFHNITMFRGQIDLNPSILSAIVESRRLSSGEADSPRLINKNTKMTQWIDGHVIELIKDIREFKKGDTVLYGKSLYTIERKFNDNINQYSISSVIDNKIQSDVDGSKLTYVRVVE
jgi:hypothetical protein